MRLFVAGISAYPPSKFTVILVNDWKIEMSVPLFERHKFAKSRVPACNIVIGNSRGPSERGDGGDTSSASDLRVLCAFPSESNAFKEQGFLYIQRSWIGFLSAEQSPLHANPLPKLRVFQGIVRDFRMTMISQELGKLGETSVPSGCFLGPKFDAQQAGEIVRATREDAALVENNAGFHRFPEADLEHLWAIGDHSNRTGNR